MPPELGPGVEVGFRGIPVHMSALDYALWTRFRERVTVPFVRLYFDVAVGRGAETGSPLPASLQQAWERITKQRIDVVGEGSDSWTLIEVRNQAGPSAIGALMVYRNLWVADPPDDRSVALWLVTDSISDNVRPTLELAGIRLFLV